MAFLQINFYSSALQMQTRVNAVLPDYGTNLPCLYLLHGIGGDSTVWERHGSIEHFVEDKNLAVIMPETYLGAYTNTQYAIPYWDYISKELPERIHSLFPQISCAREKTYAAGQSMGGYGAMKLGLGTDNFAAVASMSGALFSHANIHHALQFGSETFWGGIFGSLEKIQGTENDIFALGDQLMRSGRQPPRIYLSCGKQDDFYYANIEAKKILEDLGFHLEYHESDGAHDWNYWRKEIQSVLAWLVQ